MAMSYPKRVRIADPREEEDVMVLCRLLHAENGIFKLSEDKVRAQLRRAFNREGGILAVIGPPKDLQGMAYLQITSMWYTDDPCLEELFVYVKPEHRKSRNAVELIQFAKWCSDSSNLPLFIGIISNQKTERKVQMYERHFAKPAGNFFLYNHSVQANELNRVA